MANEGTKRAKPQLLDTPEAAAYLGLQAHTLEVWRATKRYPLPFVKVGRKVRYRAEDLDRFLLSRTVGAGAGAA
jgi:excisionase family DNA binding protein